MISCRMSLFVLLVAVCSCSLASAQSSSALRLGGIASATLFLPQATETPFTPASSNASFANRLVLLLNVKIDDRLAAFASAESWRNATPVIYSAGFNWQPFSAPVLLLRAGRFLAPFGNFLDRRYDSINPLIGRPLAYSYSSNLSAAVAPRSLEDLRQSRGQGHRLRYPSQAQVEAVPYNQGLRIFWPETYVTGLQVLGEYRRWRYAIAVTNGALANPGTLNETARPGVAGRVVFLPVMGLNAGLSAAHGVYLDYSATSRPNARRATQTVAGFDLQYSRGHVEIWGEYVFNRYRTPYLNSALEQHAAYVEAKYKLTARLYTAVRASLLRHSKIAADAFSWDYDADQLELGLGLRWHRQGFAKLSHQFNRTHGIAEGDPTDDVTSFQLVVFF